MTGYPRDTFETHFEKTDGCWIWLSYIDKRTGYGRFSSGQWAHRVSYERYVGKIPTGAVIDHLCRVRSCVNPAHLEPVTQRDNWIRGVSPTAIAAQSNHCKRGHEFTPGNTYERPDGKPGRQCRACGRIRAQRRRKTPRP